MFSLVNETFRIHYTTILSFTLTERVQAQTNPFPQLHMKGFWKYLTDLVCGQYIMRGVVIN